MPKAKKGNAKEPSSILTEDGTEFKVQEGVYNSPVQPAAGNHARLGGYPNARPLAAASGAMLGAAAGIADRRDSSRRGLVVFAVVACIVQVLDHSRLVTLPWSSVARRPARMTLGMHMREFVSRHLIFAVGYLAGYGFVVTSQ